MTEQRVYFQLYDNLIASSLLPVENIKNPDLGILKMQVKSPRPMEGSTNNGEFHFAKASFRWNYNAVELLRDVKILGKIKITGGTGATSMVILKHFFVTFNYKKLMVQLENKSSEQIVFI